MTRGCRLRLGLMLAAVSAATAALSAQAPDGNAVLRAAGVEVPRGGAEAAFDLGLTGPDPVPPGAFPTLIVGMGPASRVACARGRAVAMNACRRFSASASSATRSGAIVCVPSGARIVSGAITPGRTGPWIS